MSRYRAARIRSNPARLPGSTRTTTPCVAAQARSRSRSCASAVQLPEEIPRGDDIGRVRPARRGVAQLPRPSAIRRQPPAELDAPDGSPRRRRPVRSWARPQGPPRRSLQARRPGRGGWPARTPATARHRQPSPEPQPRTSPASGPRHRPRPREHRRGRACRRCDTPRTARRRRPPGRRSHERSRRSRGAGRDRRWRSVRRGWSGRRGSNPRHAAWKAAALPTELLPHDPTMIAGPSAASEDRRRSAAETPDHRLVRSNTKPLGSSGRLPETRV